MSEAKFTPVPWNVHEGHSSWHVVTSEDCAGPCHGFVLICEVGDEDDARLIAAAPELYEALENLLGVVDTPIARRKLGSDFTIEAVDGARKALAKARGEEDRSKPALSDD